MKQYFTRNQIIFQAIYIFYTVGIAVFNDLYFNSEDEFMIFPVVIFYTMETIVFFTSYITFILFFEKKIIYSFVYILLSYYLELIVSQWLTNYPEIYTSSFKSPKKYSLLEMAMAYDTQLLLLSFWAYIIFIIAYTKTKNNKLQEIYNIKIKNLKENILLSEKRDSIFNQIEKITKRLYESVTTNFEYSQQVKEFLDFIRIVLKHTSLDLVSFNNEIFLLEKYIYTQKQRYKNSVVLEMGNKENYEGFAIPHLTLISIVENAFKHGDFASIPIEVSINRFNEGNGQECILFKCKNLKGEKENEKSGVGNQNLLERLELLMRDKYNLYVEDNTQFYYSYLKLYKTKS